MIGLYRLMFPVFKWYTLFKWRFNYGHLPGGRPTKLLTRPTNGLQSIQICHRLHVFCKTMYRRCGLVYGTAKFHTRFCWPTIVLSRVYTRIKRLTVVPFVITICARRWKRWRVDTPFTPCVFNNGFVKTRRVPSVARRSKGSINLVF